MNAFNQVVRRDPNVALAWFYKAKLEAINGNIQLVKTFLKRAISLEPEYKEKAKSDPDIEKVKDQLTDILG